MNRLLALSTLLLAIPPAGANAAESRRPNILFILVDDQSPFDLKVYNPKSPLQTPNIDRLAREGHGLRRRLSHGLVRRRGLHAVAAHDHERADASGTCPSRPGRCEGAVPAEPGAEHDPRRLQPRRLRTMRTCKIGQQLRGRQQAVHRPQGRHQARRHARDRQRLACRPRARIPRQRASGQGHATRS